MSKIQQGVDPKYSGETFEVAKLFFEQPMEKKMEVYTGLVPNEYVGYHPLEYYSRAGRKKKSKQIFQKQSSYADSLDLCEAFNWAYDTKFDPETLDINEPSINICPEMYQE